jgi:hypothetical protein
MDRATRERVAHGGGGGSWGEASEKLFVDGLGEWNQRNRAESLGPRYWLPLYITAHEKSPHSHHKAGVTHAKKKLEGLNR